ncbi:Flp pilus assembly complex ATPase component TadA [Candidatus Kaiserbacteria bacterium]|nr:Flp pilus assembly complex ATPase component TadA [Candidatus Kaiserbacteria bacterium]
MHTLSERDIYTLLREQNYVPAEELDTAWESYPRESTSFAQFLIEKDVLTEDLLGQAIAEQFKVPYIDFDAHTITPEDRAQLPRDVAMQYRVVFVEANKNEAVVATDNPAQKGLKTALRTALKKKKITVGYTLPDTLENALFAYRPPLGEVLKGILEKDPEDAPSVIDTLFEEAVMQGASDIHFEPREESVVVRFRVDGLLSAVAALSPELYEIAVNRIKVAAQLRIDQHMAPQDGSLRIGMGDKDIDMRVSVTPIADGEKIVIRLLGEYVSSLAFSDIGMREDSSVRLRRCRVKSGARM